MVVGVVVGMVVGVVVGLVVGVVAGVVVGVVVVEVVVGSLEVHDETIRVNVTRQIASIRAALLFIPFPPR